MLLEGKIDSVAEKLGTTALLKVFKKSAAVAGEGGSHWEVSAKLRLRCSRIIL